MMHEFNEYNKQIFLSSLLYDSIEDNDKNAIKVLLKEKSANPNIVLPDKGITPFHLAVGNPKENYAEEISNLFLCYGGNPNVRSEDNMTPLHVASAWGNLSIVKLLIKFGAISTLKDDEGLTALDYAKIENHSLIIDFLEEINDNLLSETQNHYNLTLEKLIINTGNVVAEYDTNHDKNYVNTLNSFLKELPKTETNSYVQNWCVKHSMSNNENLRNETFSIEDSDSRNEPFLFFTDNFTPHKSIRYFDDDPKVLKTLTFTKNRTYDKIETISINSSRNVSNERKNLDSFRENGSCFDEKRQTFDSGVPKNTFESSFDNRFAEIYRDSEKNARNRPTRCSFEETASFVEKERQFSTERDQNAHDQNEISILGKSLSDRLEKIRKSVQKREKKLNESIHFNKSFIVDQERGCIDSNSLEKQLDKLYISKSPQNKRIADRSEDDNELNHFVNSYQTLDDDVIEIESSQENILEKNIDNLSLNETKSSVNKSVEANCIRRDTFSITDDSNAILNQSKMNSASKNGVVDKNLSHRNTFSITKDSNAVLSQSKTTSASKNRLEGENLIRCNTFSITDDSNAVLTQSKANSASKNALGDSNKDLSLRCNTFSITDDCNAILNQSKTKTPFQQKLHCKDINLSLSHNTFSITDDSIVNFSRESGIKTLSNLGSFQTPLAPVIDLNYIGPVTEQNSIQETSIYGTCSDGSLNTHEINIIDSFCKSDISLVNEQTGVNTLDHVTGVPMQVSGLEESSDDSFLSIAEEYKYTDKEDGVVLIERRYLVSPQIDIDDIKSIKSSSTVASSLPTTIDYDTDTLRNELTYRGEKPGPITTTTKRLYLKKLMKLQKKPAEKITKPIDTNRVYSIELEKTLRNPKWKDDLTQYKVLETTMTQQFNKPDPNKKWREGISKASFTYLLLDPRVTQNLPIRSEKLTIEETWKIFLSSIFYVGKGKRSRPYAHLYDALTRWEKNIKRVCNKKIQHILDIWTDEYGVVCLHIFQNVIPVEAYTREAAIISALKLENLKNAQNGNFYGVSDTWPQKQKRLLGVYLLYRAMLIFLNEGERQLRPNDI